MAKHTAARQPTQLTAQLLRVGSYGTSGRRP